jgi:hypothetical protein
VLSRLFRRRFLEELLRVQQADKLAKRIFD